MRDERPQETPPTLPERARAALRGVQIGLRAPLDGEAFLLKTRAVWPLVAAPVAAVAALALLLAIGLALGADAALARWTPPDTALGSALAVAGHYAALAVGAAAGMLLAPVLAQPLTDAALERLVTAQERALGQAPTPEEPLLVGLARSLKVVGVGVGAALGCWLVLTLVELAFPPSAVVILPLELAIGALMLAWNLLDFPLNARCVDIGERVAFFRRHGSALLGFGAVLEVMWLTPGVDLLLLPIGVLGATQLVHTLDAAGAQPTSAR